LLGLLVITELAYGISVLTQNVDNYRTGWNQKETTLTAKNVPQLKKLVSVKTPAPCTTQVLYYENLNLNNHQNVLFCWTNADQDNTNITAFAFDANTLDQIWSLYVGQGALWATQAPAIDPATNYMYFIYKNTNDNGYNYLIGIDIMKGQFLPGSHLLINASVPGTGAANENGVIPFQNTASGNARIHNDCRTSILIVNSNLFFGFAHNSDSPPYHGWAFSYTYDTTSRSFKQLAYFCTSPNSRESGIWQGGQGFASDGTSIYLTTGNGDFNPNQKSWGMAVLKMSFDLQIQDYFVPANWQQYSNGDRDLAGCGPAIIPNTSYIFVGVTKYGSVHLIDRTNMGKFTSGKDSCRQTIILDNTYIVPGGNPVVWGSVSGAAKIFVWPPGHGIYEFNYNPDKQMMDNPVEWTGTTSGGGLQISSDGENNPILWAFGTGKTFAFDLTKEITAGPIWTSTSQPGPASWGWPTISNGKLYVPSYLSTLTVYGL